MSGDASEDGSEHDSASDGSAPQPQSAALRRQQLFVGSAVAALSGMAVVVGGLQQFPGLAPAVPFGAGMVVTAATFAVVYVSVFRG